jgi:hypothetical protein
LFLKPTAKTTAIMRLSINENNMSLKTMIIEF